MKPISFIITILLLSTTPALAAKPDAVPGQYVIKLRPGLVASHDLAQDFGGKIVDVLKNRRYFVLQRKASEKRANALKALKKFPEVMKAEPNYIYRTSRMPNDPELGNLWGLRNQGQPDSAGQQGLSGIDMAMEKAWDVSTGSDSVVVAFVDTGMKLDHPDLADNLWSNTAELNGQAGIDDDGNGFVDDVHGYDFVESDGVPEDDNDHGTHVAGTIGARGDNGVGVVGVNWNVKLMPVRAFDASGTGTLANAIDALNYAAKMNARVINNSWGSTENSELLEEAIAEGAKKGVLYVVAAGNSGDNSDISPQFPAGSRSPSVISVAAVDNAGKLAWFSNYGRKSVHLAAPGVNVYSTSRNGYRYLSGTSMAAPHVAGAAALVLAREPNLTAIEVKDRLMRTAVPIETTLAKTVSRGICNAHNALLNVVPPLHPKDPTGWTQFETVSISTPHPYADKAAHEWEVEVAGAAEIALYFTKFETEPRYDTLTIFNREGVKLGEISGADGEGWTLPFPGSYLKLKFKSDDSVTKYGFDLTKMAYR